MFLRLTFQLTLIALLMTSSLVAQQTMPPTGVSSTSTETWPATNADANKPYTGNDKITAAHNRAIISIANGTGSTLSVYYLKQNNGVATQHGKMLLGPFARKILENTDGSYAVAALPQGGSATQWVLSKKHQTYVEYNGGKLFEVEPYAGEQLAVTPQPQANQPKRSDYHQVNFSNYTKAARDVTFGKANGTTVTQQVGPSMMIQYFFLPNETFSVTLNQKLYKLPIRKQGNVTISDSSVTYNGEKLSPAVAGGVSKLNPHRIPGLVHIPSGLTSDAKVYLESAKGRIGLGTNIGALRDIVQVTQSGAAYRLKRKDGGDEVFYKQPVAIWTQSGNGKLAISDGAYWNTYLQNLDYKSEQLWVFENWTVPGTNGPVKDGHQVYIRRSDKPDVYLYAKADGVLGVTNRANERTLFTLRQTQ